MTEGKHVCMLESEPTGRAVSPRAGWGQRLLAAMRALAMPAEWHRASMLFVRSHNKLQQEQILQIRAGHWYVLHPYSPLKFYWECYKLIIFCSAFFYSPVTVFFKCPDFYDKFTLFSDLTAFWEIVVNFLTGRLCEDGKSVELRPRYIAIGYLKSDFLFDLIGALPLQTMPLHRDGGRCECPIQTSWLIFKLFRLPASNRAWSYIKLQFEFSYIRSTSVILVFFNAMFFHWITCFNFQVCAFLAHLYPDDDSYSVWYERLKVKLNVSAVDKYMTNLYHVSGFSFGTTGLVLNIIPSLIMSSIIGISGLLYLMYACTGIVRLIFYHQFETHIFNGRLRVLHEYFHMRRLPTTLRQKVQLFINYKYNGHFFNEQAIMETINEQIKQEINMFSCKKLVTNVPLFKDMPIALINSIIFSLNKVLFMPGEVVMKCGKPGSSLYLIASGTVTVIDSEGQELAHLTDGAYFGERALLYPGSPRTATVVALEITEIYKLSHQQLSVCLQPNPRLRRRLEDAGRQRPLYPGHTIPRPARQRRRDHAYRD